MKDQSKDLVKGQREQEYGFRAAEREKRIGPQPLLSCPSGAGKLAFQPGFEIGTLKLVCGYLQKAVKNLGTRQREILSCHIVFEIIVHLVYLECELIAVLLIIAQGIRPDLSSLRILVYPTFYLNISMMYISRKR
jgi:hypothetical protein